MPSSWGLAYVQQVIERRPQDRQRSYLVNNRFVDPHAPLPTSRVRAPATLALLGVGLGCQAPGVESGNAFKVTRPR